jgi:hypothetical protein
LTGRIGTLAVVAVGSSLALAGCGGGGGSTTATTSTSAQGTVIQNTHVLRVIAVHETEYSLAPKLIHIQRFGYYGLKAINDGKVPHALALHGHGLHQRTGEIAPGRSRTMLVFFRKAGNYLLYCPLDGHARKGMKATVRVH